MLMTYRAGGVESRKPLPGIKQSDQSECDWHHCLHKDKQR